MIEKIYLGLILIFFILAFAIRNFKTYLSTKQSIKGKSLKLTISIFLSTTIYLLILLRLTLLKQNCIFEFDLSNYLVVKYIGLTFVSAGFIIGLLALIAMKNSWRVGIKYDQKTDLITSGIYRLSRNPYFFSYDILILGYILIFPSIFLIVIYLSLAITFHMMILEEEKYLHSVHGGSYIDYKKKVRRYL
jgi:protein-S-isoprenylcysteine O-methyltransferase Ste14